MSNVWVVAFGQFRFLSIKYIPEYCGCKKIILIQNLDLGVSASLLAIMAAITDKNRNSAEIVGLVG